MKVNNEATLKKKKKKKQLLPLSETICALTFHRLFEFSDYIVAIETLQLSPPSLFEML